MPFSIQKSKLNSFLLITPNQNAGRNVQKQRRFFVRRRMLKKLQKRLDSENLSERRNLFLEEMRDYNQHSTQQAIQPFC